MLIQHIVQPHSLNKNVIDPHFVTVVDTATDAKRSRHRAAVSLSMEELSVDQSFRGGLTKLSLAPIH